MSTLTADTVSPQTRSTARTPVTAKNALFTFYDIESLQNVFTLCSFAERTNRVDVFFLVDPGTAVRAALDATGGIDVAAATEVILRSNPAYAGSDIHFHDLSLEHANHELALMFGLSDADPVNNPREKSSYGAVYRPVCDTDQAIYDPINRHPYFAGFNSYNYDTPMLALYFMESMAHITADRTSDEFKPASAAVMRYHNDQLFSAAYRERMPNYLTQGPVSGGKGWKSPVNRIRAAMLNSGRHIDVARMNEKQRLVGLKRLLGMLGYQIMESDKLGSHNAVIETLDELYELLAYNVSDVIGLANLFKHPSYAGSFDLKKGLLDEYKETIYEKRDDSYAPDERPWRVRRNRLTPDSSSARFVGLVLSPYSDLADQKFVSYDYPSAKVAQERGIEQVNVLESAREFFYANVTDQAARDSFDAVYRYYKSIEGRNFNDSPEYQQLYPGTPISNLANIPKAPCNLPYFHADGSPSTCFVTFSTGGIHGAEADVEAYQTDLAEYRALEALFAEVKAIYPDPLELRKARTVTVADGRVLPWKDFLTASSTIKNGCYYKDISKKEPHLFVDKEDGSNRLHTKYAYTSIAPAIHEDFTSYYPLLLGNMAAFYNADLGDDRYRKIFLDKELYGKMMKDPAVDPAEKARLGVLRNGTKLILNSASGAGDAGHKTPIRMNNRIISMRIIGQLFSWRIGQAQTLAGARIISTNTDGLYSVLDEETNNRVLDEQAAIINVDIEPEPMILVSKDSNNRLELVRTGDMPWQTKVQSASGGSLSCYKGPNPEKSLAHPAILDHALTEYLRAIAGGYQPAWASAPLSIDAPFDLQMGRAILTRVLSEFDPVHAAMMFQNILAASAGSITYPFASDPVVVDESEVTDEDDDEAEISGLGLVNPRPLQHYNRVFVVRAGTPGAVNLRNAGAYKVNAVMAAKRKRDGGLSRIVDPIAEAILLANGLATNRPDAKSHKVPLAPEDQDIVVRKISSVDSSWPMLVVNSDLHHLGDAQIHGLLDSLDLEIYLTMIAQSFEKNWQTRARLEDDSTDEE